MMIRRKTHIWSACATLTALALIFGCNSPAGPGSGSTPEGSLVAWVNGLGATVDLYFQGSDSLVSSAYITGDSPNDLLYLGDNRLAILSSLSSRLQVVDLSQAGSVIQDVQLPAGGNPWAMTHREGRIWITLTQMDALISVSTSTWSIEDSLEVRTFPYGVAAAEGRIFVSYGDFYPDTTAGGVSVFDAETLQETGWLDTGRNTSELWFCEETGNVHAFATTYTDDGVISIIDPSSASIISQVLTGGAPMSPVKLKNGFACCDGWGTSIFFYDETGAVSSTWNPDTSLTLAGMCVLGDTLYMTDFNGDRVLRGLWATQTLLSSLQGGDGPQMMISVER